MTSTATRLFGKGIAFPPRIDELGRLAWSEGEPNVEESIRILLSTEAGERVNLPAYGAGLGRFLFEPNTVSTHAQIERAIAEAVGRWEPRAKVESVKAGPDPQNPEAARAVLVFRLVATQAVQRISLSIPTSGQVPS